MSLFTWILLAILWLALYEIARLKIKPAHKKIWLLFIATPLIHLVVLFTDGFIGYIKEDW